MKITNIILPIIILLIACKGENSTESKTTISHNSVEVEDNTPKITGIGGVFFKSKNPQDLKKWYNTNLGLVVDDFGAPFEFRNANKPDEVNYLNWDAFPDTTTYFNPSTKDFMINYRVQNIIGLVEKLKANNVTIVDEIASYEFGKFVHIIDSEGNNIELWEPVDSALSTFDRATNK